MYTVGHETKLTVLSKEQSTDRTTCFSGQVVMYVIALIPTTGNIFALIYIDLDVKVRSSRKISQRLLSNSLLVPTGVLQPTPLCHIAYETLLLPVAGIVNPPKNKRSMRVSINSSASGLASSYFSLGDNPLLCGSDASVSSNSTSGDMEAFLVSFFRGPQNILSSHSCKLSDSYKYGRIRVRTLTQLRASCSGASSGSGKLGWFRSMESCVTVTTIKVSRFSLASSLVRRTSAEEKRLKTSSAPSGSSQNCQLLAPSNLGVYDDSSQMSSTGRRQQYFALQRA